MYGIMFEDSPYLNVINPNCYDGIIGVRYIESGELPDGGSISNFDPFVVEVSQDIPCEEFADFGLTIFYTTSGGNCTSQCSQILHFSLPVFSFDKPFILKDESELFQSANDQPILGTATNGQSIGMFFNGSGGTYFSELNLDGLPLTGPTKITSYISVEMSGSAIYNFDTGKYYLFEGGGTLIPQDGFGITELQKPPGVTEFLSMQSSFYDMESFATDSMVVVADTDTLHTYLLRYYASDPYQLIDYVDLGENRDNYYQPHLNRMVSLYDKNLSLYNYFVAYEIYSGSSHKIKIAKIRGNDLYIENTYEINLPFEDISSFSIEVSKNSELVALAYQKTDSDLTMKIFGVTFDKDLTPINPEFRITNPDTGKYSSMPLLVDNYNTFLLISKEAIKSTYNVEGARVKVSLVDFANQFPPQEIYSAYASDTWLNINNIKGFQNSDKVHLFWNDTRDRNPNSRSIHYVEARNLHPFAPYNITTYDDEMISQEYEESLHPSIACKEDDCLVAWRNILNGGPDATVFYRKFNIDGTSIDTLPIPIFYKNLAPSDAHPIAKNHNGNYEIFWKDYDTSMNQSLIARWRDISSGGTAESLFNLESSDPQFLDATPALNDSDLLAVSDQKSGDMGMNLYLYLCPHSGSVSSVKITDYDSYTELSYAKIVKIEGGQYPYAVAWLEKNSFSSNYSQLWFAYLDSDLSIVSGYPVWIEYWPNIYTGEFALSANQNIITLLFSFQDDINSYTLQFRVYNHPLDRNAYTSYDLWQIDSASTNSTFLYPVIKWNGTYFDFSWVEEGSSAGSGGNERLFFIDHLDECGNFVSWPVRIGSYLSYMADGWDFNYETERTKKGFLATYNKGSGSMSFNVYLTPLSWDAQSTICNLFNVPPVVSTNGPFTIEYGSGVDLTGSAKDDIAMGDFIYSAGWDVTQDGVADFSGVNISISFEQLYQKGWVAPATKTISLLATDRNGASASSSTTLTIQDTTPPLVNVVFPNGGDTLIEGGGYTILWSASDNYQLDHFDLFYCTDFNGSDGTWLKINSSPIPGNTFSYNWIVPSSLSSTCRIKVEAFDKAFPSNSSSDISNSNFYIVQATTSSIKTLFLRNNTRIEMFYPGKSSLVSEKLAKIITNDKVHGFIVEVDSILGIDELYSLWDLDPTNQNKANDVANSIRNYVKNLVRNTYTNAEYIVIVGDDRIIPFFRIPDSTPGSYSEDDYIGEVDCNSMTGSAICQNYYLTDNNYGDLGHFEDGEWREYESTSAGVNYMALPDLSIGRLVESPEQIATTIDNFITLDGQITLDSLVTADVFTSGYDFLNDSAQSINDLYDANYVVDNLIGNLWTADNLEDALCSNPHTINSLNNHANHYSLICPDRWLQTSEINGDYPSQIFNGRVFYNAGCHSGLNVPSTFSNSFDLPELMMEKGAISYIGNTGFGWGLKQGIGYTERLLQILTQKMLLNNISSLGKSLIEAKREYFIEDKRYDVFDEKILFESTLYGLPMYKIVMNQIGFKDEPKDFSGPSGADEEEINGIKLKKSLIDQAKNTLLPPGVTELSLQFEFGPGTYQLINTSDGSYYKLNGKSNGEAGDSLQPLFIYESKLSGVVSKGVIFTGGEFTNYSPFNPAIAAPQSSSPIIPPEPIAPITGAFIPTVNVVHPQLPSSIVSTDFTKMTVYTGYYDDSNSQETLFNTMNFSIYYSNSSDSTPPVISDPGQGNNLHTLNGTNCTFSVSVTDANSGVFRVIITYTDGISEWNSLDLNFNPSNSKWENSLSLKRDITYFVQAVDNAGNVKVLKVNEGLGDINPETGLPYVISARLFSVDLLDEDNDGMEDTWESQNGLNPTVNDANLDPDYDGLTNYEEFLQDTEPNNSDTDGDGDNDGSELHNGRNPLSSSDGKRITITTEKVGNDIILHFEDGLGENSLIDGPYWVYRSTNDPHFDDTEILVTTPYPLPDGTTYYTDVGAGSGTDIYYYTVVNARFDLPAPTIDAVVPSSGPVSGGTPISIYGSNFSNGANVKIGGVNATNIVVINSTKITCKTPPNSAGAKDVVVTNLNGQFGTLTNGFTYY